MALQLKISIRHSQNPTIWRRIKIDGNASFYLLHLAIQGSFGWEFSHLFRFAKNERDFAGIGMLWDDPMTADETKTRPADHVKLHEELIQENQTYYYLYDFGDNWEHDILVEKISDKTCPKPKVLAGEGMGPPENCGGIPGYYHLLEILKDSKHPDHEHMIEWLGIQPGYYWDKAYFSAQFSNEEMDGCIQMMGKMMKDGKMIGY